MSHSETTSTPIFGARAAAVLGGIFLGVYGILALLGALDRAQRPQLESVEAVSAVGDPVVFALPAPPAEAPSILHGGVALKVVKTEPAHDDDLRKAGCDDSGRIPLYRRLARDGHEFTPGYRVKLAPGFYAVLDAPK